ncbi:2Fe-2S iron-sulfur cluster-binding protein [Curvivirga sp.]|uniref:2Fe-2S iron-sulfur cluster-binding protein n=1 Tax=Curvivirga sp. TaxID=2856848 RepID=UPI003B5C5E4A
MNMANKSFWKDSEILECVSVVPEVPNTATFSFRSPSGAYFDYKPGQFVTLEIPAPDQPGGVVHRTYTISSSPSRPGLIAVTVKAQEGSIGTRWMLDNLKPGMRMKAMGPAGVFTNADSKASKYLFISAGSGITPMMSMTTYMWDEGHDLDIVFINCAKRPSEIIFKQGLERMASRAPGLDLKFVVEEPDPYSPWTGYQGQFNQLMLGLMAQDYLDREVYCCGPEPFMQAVREALAGLGFNMDNYFQESFGAPVKTEAEQPDLDDVIPDDESKAEIHFTSSDVTIKVPETETVLAAARSSGLNIPSGCTFGVCGTCKVKKTKGEVHMVHNGGISEEDVEDGFILACCSHPIGQVEIEC